MTRDDALRVVQWMADRWPEAVFDSDVWIDEALDGCSLRHAREIQPELGRLTVAPTPQVFNELRAKRHDHVRQAIAQARAHLHPEGPRR